MRRTYIALILCWALCFQTVWTATAQRVNRVQLNPGGEFDIVSFGANGAVCGASAAATDAALTRAQAAVATAGGGTIWFPDRTCTIAAIHTFTTPGVTLRGYGSSSVLKAANGANLAFMLRTTEAATGFTVRDMVLDGNRANGGMIQGSPTNAHLLANGSGLLIDNVELKNSQAVGIFVGSNTTPPVNTRIINSYFHDIGGVIDGSGFGVGVYTGGTQPPRGLVVQGNTFARIYNTITTPGPSNAFSGGGGTTEVMILGNHFEDNFSGSTLGYGGGMVNLFGDGGDCSASPNKNLTVQGNTFRLTTTVLSDVTAGVEACGQNSTIVGNTFDGMTGPCIEVNGGTTQGVIAGNTCRASATGILLGSATYFQITGNTISATLGINFSTALASHISVTANNLSGSTTKFSGLPIAATQDIVIGPNLGYDQIYTTTVSGVTAAQSITATTHAQGVEAIAKCFDNSTPRVNVACNWTRAANGDLLVGPFAPAFSGLIQVGPN